jgi:hypothetical protein
VNLPQGASVTVLPIPLRLKLIDFAQQANCTSRLESLRANPAAARFRTTKTQSEHWSNQNAAVQRPGLLIALVT